MFKINTLCKRVRNHVDSKINLSLFCVVILVNVASAQNQKVELFKLADVKVLGGPMKQAQDVDLKYMLALDPDRLLAPFCEDAGITPKAPKYPNWESMGLNGHIGGHYLTALASMYKSTGNEELLRRLNYMVSVLAECQAKNGNGYVGGIPNVKPLWKELKNGVYSPQNGIGRLNKYWVPWYNLHKTFAGLRDAYLITGNEQAKEVLIKLSDWCYTNFSGLTEAQFEEMFKIEYGGMNEVLADVYAMTGNKKYLTLAQQFSHKAILNPLKEGQDKLNGLHANTQIPKVIGFERISQFTGDEKWHNAASFFWETVVNHRTVAFGGNSVREHFYPVNDYSLMIADASGPETCNTYNMLKLTKMLYTDSNALKYINYYERAVFNHILSSQHPEKGGFVYITSIHPQHYRCYSTNQANFWCCVGTGMENHAKYGELIYAHNSDDLFVNLFIPSQLNWKEKGITITQETNFPESETSTLKLKLTKPSVFAVQVRYPQWVKAGDMVVRVNGKAQKINAQPGTYIILKREWKMGDVITLNMPMHTTAEYLPDNSPYAAFLYGPIVLAAKTSDSNLDNLYGENGTQKAIGKLIPTSEAPVITTSDANFASELKPVKGKPLTFTAKSLISPSNFKDLQLIPFYKLHDARYMIYWNVKNHQDSQKN